MVNERKEGVKWGGLRSLTGLGPGEDEDGDDDRDVSLYEDE